MEDNKYLVVGAGRSGKEAAKLILEKGEKAVIYDGNKNFSVEEFIKKNPNLKHMDYLKGNIEKKDLLGIKEAILSPGVPIDSDIVKFLRQNNIKVIGEVEFAFENSKGDLIGITGTNGKTTTTALTGEIFKNHFKEVFVVGNIGIPYTSVALKTKDNSKTVAEISSFQLESIEKFHPHVSAILNVTSDHLNRHHTFLNYLHMKERITENQNEDDICILNYDDKNLYEFSKKLKCKIFYFSVEKKLEKGMFYENNAIYYADGEKITKVIEEDELNIIGLHNIANAEAAIAIAISFNIPMDEIRKGLKSFKAVEHRIEYVTTKRGIKFYDDSKGTNPDASIKAVMAIKEPIILIAGGYDKKISYDDFVDTFPNRVKKVILMGDTKDEIKKSCDRIGFKDYEFAKDLKEAVDLCYKAANKGETILLSPASASWDMFKSYEERGDLFKEYVRKLPE